MKNEILTIEGAITKYHNGTWMVYNVIENEVRMIRIENGKPASFKGGLAKKNLLNISMSQYNEVKAAAVQL